MSGEVERSQVENLEIIQYYYRTKGGVVTMDKILGKNAVKCRTFWQIAYFYHWFGIMHYVQRTQPRNEVKGSVQRHRNGA